MPQIRLFGHKLAKKYDKIKSQKVRDGKISIYHTRIVLGELLTTNRDEKNPHTVRAKCYRKKVHTICQIVWVGLRVCQIVAQIV